MEGRILPVLIRIKDSCSQGAVHNVCYAPYARIILV
jgi:hypothetical protein